MKVLAEVCFRERQTNRSGNTGIYPSSLLIRKAGFFYAQPRAEGPVKNEKRLTYVSEQRAGEEKPSVLKFSRKRGI